MAVRILTEKIEDLHKLAKALLTYETLTGTEIEIGRAHVWTPVT